MPLQVEIHASFGVYDCTIQPEIKDSETVYHVGVKRQNADPDKAYPIYIAYFYMEHAGDGYRIRRHKKALPEPLYWQEMESLVANHIIVNS